MQKKILLKLKNKKHLPFQVLDYNSKINKIEEVFQIRKII